MIKNVKVTKEFRALDSDGETEITFKAGEEGELLRVDPEGVHVIIMKERTLYMKKLIFNYYFK